MSNYRPISLIYNVAKMIVGYLYAFICSVVKVSISPNQKSSAKHCSTIANFVFSIQFTADVLDNNGQVDDAIQASHVHSTASIIGCQSYEFVAAAGVPQGSNYYFIELEPRTFDQWSVL